MDDPQLKSLIDTYYKMQIQEPGDEFEAEPETLDEAVGGSVKLKPGKGLGGGVLSYPKGKEPKATGAKLPLANSHEVEGEEISEMVPALQKPVEGALRKTREFMQKNPVGRAIGSAIAPVGRGRSTAKPAAQPGTYTRESTEAYDIVLDFLISEGYADSVENADQIMAVMAEGKIKEIVEAKKD